MQPVKYALKFHRNWAIKYIGKEPFTTDNMGTWIMPEQQVSYCRQEIMSMCAAGSDNQQKLCRYYEKSYASARCMYYVFEEYCDCLKAQVTAHGAC